MGINNAEISSLIEKLRSSETIKCAECGKGEYVTSASDIKLAKEFRCNKCGSVVRITPNILID